MHSFIIGEHGDSELAVWSSANISGVDLDRFCEKCSKHCSRQTLHSLFDDVKTSAYKIIEAKDATYYAIAESVRKIVTAIMLDEDSILPLSTLLSGEYGINDVCLGVPCVVGANGIKKVLEIPLDDTELSMLRASGDKLRGIIENLDIHPFAII